jgi:FkbM family methyltransferase
MKKKLEALKFIVRFDFIAAIILLSYAWIVERKVHLFVKKVDSKCWRVTDGAYALNIFTPYRLLNYRSGISARLNRLAESYGFGSYYQIKRGDIVIDIGANIGEFSLFCATKGARVFAFEPDFNAFRLLKENVNTNLVAKKRVSIHDIAISDKTGVINFYLKPLEADSTIISPKNPEDFKRVEITTTRLDEYFSNNGIGEVIKLVKCDAEGAEPEVVYGCEKIFPYIDLFAIDCGPERNGKCTYPEVSLFLEKSGFKILSTPEQTCRGLVVAKNMSLRASVNSKVVQ